jgi:hypothetical protein
VSVPGNSTRQEIARAFDVPVEMVEVAPSEPDRFTVTVTVHGQPIGEWAERVYPVVGHGDVLQNLRPTKEGEMPATIPGTPHTAEDLEAIALKHMDLETAADRSAAAENARMVFEEAIEKRNNAVMALLQHGFQQQAIADAMNISRSLVAQIVRARRRAEELSS